jgi:hypothetical protein
MSYLRPPYAIVEQRLVTVIQALPDPETTLAETLRPAALREWEAQLEEMGMFSLKAGALAGSAAAPYPADWLFDAIDDDPKRWAMREYEGTWLPQLQATPAPAVTVLRRYGLGLRAATASEGMVGLFVLPVIQPACDASPLPSVDAYLFIVDHADNNEQDQGVRFIGARIRKGFEDVTMLDPDFRGLGIGRPFTETALALRLAFSRLLANPDSPLVRTTYFTPEGLKTIRSAIVNLRAELVNSPDIGHSLQAAWDPVIEAAVTASLAEEGSEEQEPELVTDTPTPSRPRLR